MIAKVKYSEFLEGFKILQNQYFKKKVNLPFNMQFYLHEQLSKTWTIACSNEKLWKNVLLEMSNEEV